MVVGTGPYRERAARPYFAPMAIYTRTGDDGETGLFGGGRVPKHALRVRAYGDVDELNASLGAAIACEPDGFEASLLEKIQRDLFVIGGRLAAPSPGRAPKQPEKTELDAGRIDEMEDRIDEIDAEAGALTAFVLPGGSAKAAALHVARTVCRRAERTVTALAADEAVPSRIVVYLNRLSDLLFALARLANHRAGVADRTW